MATGNNFPAYTTTPTFGDVLTFQPKQLADGRVEVHVFLGGRWQIKETFATKAEALAYIAENER